MTEATTRRIDADWLQWAETRAMFAALASHGIEARVVGGAVRNTLIGKAASDIDVATPAPPQAVIAAARAAGLGVVPTGLQHGTVTVVVDRVSFEVTTLRRDVATDGRHAVVAFTTEWAADAARRDFTINALYAAADGTLYDPLGTGLADLDARHVRFIGDAAARLSEDYLRLLRFFRFSAEYGDGALDADGLQACSRARDGLGQLSAERIRSEVLKILVAPRADEVTALMFAHGYWPALLGCVPWPEHVARRITWDGEQGRRPDAIERLAVLAVARPEAAAALSARLKLSRADSDRLEQSACLATTLSVDVSDHDLRYALYRAGRAVTTMAVAIAEARRGSSARAWHHVQQRAAHFEIPALPVRGQDLLDRGMAAGVGLGRHLAALEQTWIESDFTASRATLLAQ